MQLINQKPQLERYNKAPLNFTKDLAKRMIFRAFDKLEIGTLIVQEGNTHHKFQGKSDTDFAVTIIVNNNDFYEELINNGTMGAAETYMKSYWISPDLLKVIRLMLLNQDALSSLGSFGSMTKKAVSIVSHWLKSNTRRGSQKNIAHHYDLGNKFFECFLDSSMMYSAAIFAQNQDSLLQASINKLDIICRKLQLKTSDHLLEIGTGWGGLAIHAARYYGCQVTTTTISSNQYDYVNKKVKSLGLENKITVLLKDYRDLQGRFDKLVSIEMIEAVGPKFYNNYFDQCNNLLNDDGLMIIQAITIPDQLYYDSLRSVNFIQKYIFPGGSLPSNQVIFDKVASRTNMQIIGFEDITLHYADTLKSWRNNFFRNIDKIRNLGYSEEFCRMWEYYLCYCEGGFRERSIGTGQFLLAKPDHRNF